MTAAATEYNTRVPPSMFVDSEHSRDALIRPANGREDDEKNPRNASRSSKGISRRLRR